MLLTIGFALFIAFYFRPRLTSTYIGLALGGTAFLLALFSAGKSARLYHRLNDTCPNTQYLQTLSSLRKQEYFHRHTMLNTHFVLLSLGLCLYMYEYTFARSWPTGIAVRMDYSQLVLLPSAHFAKGQTAAGTVHRPKQGTEAAIVNSLCHFVEINLSALTA